MNTAYFTTGDELIQIVAPDGARAEASEFSESVADITTDKLCDLYEDLVVVRRIDAEATALQRQGELGTVGAAARAGGSSGRLRASAAQ